MMTSPPDPRPRAHVASMCDYCDSVITLGEFIGRIDEGRYICSSCAHLDGTD